MNRDDFRYMWRGKPLRGLGKPESSLLEPIFQKGRGNQRALLLLHGFSSSPAVFRVMLQALLPYDAILCPTLPGHGENISAFGTVKAQDWLTASEIACETLVQNYASVDVLGLSLGGLLACHLSQHFKLHHLYLLAPALALSINIPLALKGLHLIHYSGVQSIRNRAGNLCSKRYGELAYRRLPLTAIMEILTLIQTFPFTPPTCPTDLFLGRFDEVVHTKKIANLMKNVPNCETHWLANSAHVLPLDNDVDQIIQRMV